ncbi:Mov34/MPN/PAD-1 family protein [Pyrococcus yayanosii]|uniref:Predicted metalloprotease, containing Jab1/MPN domain n=1 Tax=Pyrococcus yayanosii (strain CH1 / JCM 16557) TaxID=529709 RepID=F8AIB7_PYRYC|nr:Mov34/MPN/PAD-1 family protein [Pyrococcus yayanosii]AEH25520.1 Predicted metalloprotease, containing Jab1/MPN domain [Pyrococcus yayanosii CH1]
MRIKIRKELLEYLLELARGFHPNEFAGFLRENNGVFEEVLIVPKGYFGRNSVFFDPWLLPPDESIKGTVHSHPIPNAEPSKADLGFFSKFGGVHVIIAFPYTEEDVKAYGSDGKELEVEVV